jgi:hypothetical protein
LQDIELARISQQVSCQTSQPERQLRSSDEVASERPDDNGQRQFPWSGTALTKASRALRGIVSLSMYRSSLISASSVFDLDQCFLLVMSAL